MASDPKYFSPAFLNLSRNESFTNSVFQNDWGMELETAKLFCCSW